MKIYFNGIELVALCVCAICFLILGFCYIMDYLCLKYYGSKFQKFAYKLFRIHR
jgi:hypothetical protein